MVAPRSQRSFENILRAIDAKNTTANTGRNVSQQIGSVKEKIFEKGHDVLGRLQRDAAKKKEEYEMGLRQENHEELKAHEDDPPSPEDLLRVMHEAKSDLLKTSETRVEREDDPTDIDMAPHKSGEEDTDEGDEDNESLKAYIKGMLRKKGK